MTNIYLLTSVEDDGPYAFTTHAYAAEWFMENIVKEYCEWRSDADEELTDLCGPNYLDPDYGVLEILLDKFGYILQKVPLDPN